MTAKTEITRADILPLDDYEKIRDTRRQEVRAIKAHRRLDVGPFASFYFENFDTMLHQIHEMLRIEKGGEAQLEDELRAYNPLVPKGAELVATVMLEIEDPDRRDRILATLGGIEHKMVIRIGAEVIQGVAEEDTERTSPDGKASSVQFIHFPFTPEQVQAFKDGKERIEVGIEHENYAHSAVMPEAVRTALQGDFAA